ncbi:GDSL-like Lipase/Acylhydrolase [Pseudobythopirellula maris]|uniref:GDSL-like Lipase/Acylhydrolase n=1 Tax=Pseudobythopirellula maris TaxID=2527991 RepID=A0A5C5ZSG2_9BACT|nr:GDSL-type esterase/lipase family protein [Pseudobythopirellula maris]TWT90200.1 GDSL-like Lipase/Acylhydrolase [Pseudobythopirellula maris]
MISHSSRVFCLLVLATLGLLIDPATAADFEAWPRGDQNSKTAHRQLLEKLKQGKIDVYFQGDSITRRWGCTDPAYTDLKQNWRSHFHGWNAANFAWGGDTTHNILWRIENGEMEGIDPKVLVLQAGTNDIGWRQYNDEQAEQKAAEVVRGIQAILAASREKAPHATVLLTGVFPRGDNPAVNGMIATINERLAGLADGEGLRFININDRLTDDEGRLLEGVTVDGLHLSASGYDIWAAALKPHLTDLLGPPAEQDLSPPPTGDPSAAK